MSLQPFFVYYGGKWRSANRYPRPDCKTIIEPFAGAAGYALRHPDREVLLIDQDEIICGIWDYLIHVKETEILSLPNIEVDQLVSDLHVCQEARWLIGFWVNKGSAAPCNRPSTWMRSQIGAPYWWGESIRERLARQIPAIRHWKVAHGDYVDAPDVKATWFIDPPYQRAGVYYRKGSDEIDFMHLGAWCQSLKGQVIVCENEGADWLPFRPFRDIQSNPSKKGSKLSREVIWTNAPPAPDVFTMFG